MTDDESKRIILSRRARFIAAALASAGLAANPACGGNTDDSESTSNGGGGGSGGQTRDANRDRNDEPQVCLQPPGGFGGVGGVGGGPIDAPSEPTVCLSIGIDARADAPDAASDADAAPQPCLVPPK